MPVIPAFGLSQEDYKFGASLDYLRLKCPRAGMLLDGRELAWHLQALGSIPSTETKRRKKRRWLSYHFCTLESHVLYRVWSTKLVFQVASARQPPWTGLVAWGSDRSLTHPENTSHTSAWGDYSLTSHTFERAKA